MSTIDHKEVSQWRLDEISSRLSLPEDIITNGLNFNLVEKQRKLYGYNDVKDVEDSGTSHWIHQYLEQFRNPFILLLFISALISIIMGQLDDAISISLAILIVVTVGFAQEYRSEKTLERLKCLLPPMCKVKRNRGEMYEILTRDLVPGDLVVLTTGDRVPADIRLVSVDDNSSFSVDESSFTGESKAQMKSSKPSLVNRGDGETSDSQHNGKFASNICFHGTLVVEGDAVGIVFCTGVDSQFGSIVKLMQEEQNPRTPLQKNMDLLGKQLSVYSLSVIALIMVIGIVRGRGVMEMFNIGVSLAVAAIPEGLPIVTTVTLAFGVMRMAKRNAVVKRLPTVEALGSVNVICCDKTGTLTTNEMVVSDLITANTNNSSTLTESDELNKALMVISLCNNAKIAGNLHHHVFQQNENSKDLLHCQKSAADVESQPSIIGSPTESALLKYIINSSIKRDREITDDPFHNWSEVILNKDIRFERLTQIPFNSDRKMMQVEVTSDSSKQREDTTKASTWLVKGAFEKLVKMCENSSSDCISSLNYFSKMNHILSADGKRVLALAMGPSQDQLTLVGLVALRDPPRHGIKESVNVLREAQIRTCMITGDCLETAESIAKSLDIITTISSDTSSTSTLPYGECISGHELDEMNEDRLITIIDDIRVFYRTLPKHKVRIVNALQQLGHVVAMTGDGVNDSVAMKKSDVGISMGSGTDVCKEASDIVLLDNNFNTIVEAIEEGKSIFQNIRHFISFQLSTSIAALMLISISTLANIPSPLNAMQILWINVIMDGPPAQSLGLEPRLLQGHRRLNLLFEHPPRPRSQHILNAQILTKIFTSASVIILGCLSTFMFVVMSSRDDDLFDSIVLTSRETTITFTCFVLFDMFNALTCRSNDKLIISEVGLFSNSYFCWAVSLSMLGQVAVVYWPPLQYIFQTERLTLVDWLALISLASTVFFVGEGKKLWDRRRAAYNNKRGDDECSGFSVCHKFWGWGIGMGERLALRLKHFDIRKMFTFRGNGGHKYESVKLIV